jgi:hypothetical protein
MPAGAAACAGTAADRERRPMSWLVLASDFDEAARWAADGLAARGIEPVCFVSHADLAGAVWEHHIAADGVRTRIELADGRTLDSTEIRATLNRMAFVPAWLVDDLVLEDRTYGLQELSALVLSWLQSFPVPTINPPSPRGMSGPWRSPAEWASMSSRAGLDVMPIVFDSASDTDEPSRVNGALGWCSIGPAAPAGEDVIVVGDAVFSHVALSDATVEACRRLAVAAQIPILGLGFAECDERWVVAGVTPLPDLRAGGDEIIDAVAALLSGVPSTSVAAGTA